MAEITLLDGSIGQELMKRSGDAPTQWPPPRVWSTEPFVGVGICQSSAGFAYAGFHRPPHPVFLPRGPGAGPGD